MLKHSKRVLIGGTALFGGGPDKDDPFTPGEAEFRRRLDNFEKMYPSSGWERVKFGLLYKDEYGDASPFMTNILTSTISAMFGGFVYGGFKKGTVAYQEFVRSNQATAFLTHHDAKRRLQDRLSVSFMKGGAQLGWRTGLFTFMFMTVSNSVALYRKQDGILEYSLGGACAGSVYRLHVGVRGVIVGAVLGLSLGTICGILSYAVYSLTGYSATDARNAQYMFVAYRESVKRRGDEMYDRGKATRTEMLKRIEEDEAVGRIEDNLQKIDVASQGDNSRQIKSEAKVEAKIEPKVESTV